ncbi:MAG: hypothetical protein PWP15_1133 [Methanothermococcus sp.]|uniref:hypothetical protein n=1 Tax=Methanothermococcus sp. TaxID=2614238 RepID=UPI0025862046|nr:hypothetical protein [Methanothermococcus sp.]MDK2790626.1 hypothetical protein [Methanothermococcus sp.]
MYKKEDLIYELKNVKQKIEELKELADIDVEMCDLIDNIQEIESELKQLSLDVGYIIQDTQNFLKEENNEQ